MDPIRQVLARASRRMLLAAWIRYAVVLLTVAAAAAVLARGAQKLFPTLAIDWSLALPVAGGAAVLLALVIAWVRRPDELGVARVVDERAGLRETLSTALAVHADTGAWSRAVVDDAGRKAGRVVVRDAAPIEAPGNSWWPVAACAALLAVWWLPAYDVAGLLGDREAREDERRQVREVAGIAEETRREIEAMLAEAGLDLEDADDAESENPFDPERLDQLTPEEMRRAAMKELTNLSDQLEEQLRSAEQMTFDAIEDAMRRMEQPGPGPLTEMSRAMSRGDFAEANRMLQEAMAQIQSGSMSEDDKEAMQEQLEALAETLRELAENRERLEEQLQSAGMSASDASRMAADPEALEQALKEMGLNQSQIDALKKQAEAQQGACDAAASMSQAMSQMAEAMPAGSSAEMGQCASELGDQLSALEAMKAERMSLKAALSMCENGMGMCANPGNRPGNSANPGGMRAGIGSMQREFGEGPDQPTIDFETEMYKAENNANRGGPVIASTLVYGTQVRGESTAAFSDAVRSAETEAAEALESRRVPREHEAAVKAYFGRLKRAAESAGDGKEGAQGGD